VSAKRISQPFSLRTPGMMTHHNEFNFSSHQRSPIKKPHNGGYCLDIRMLLRFHPG
jgi:hypothetical protein